MNEKKVKIKKDDLPRIYKEIERNYIDGNIQTQNLINDLIDQKFIIETNAIMHMMETIINNYHQPTCQNLIKKTTDINSQENFGNFITFVEDNDKEYYLIGDLHDDFISLKEILKSINFAQKHSNQKLIFLGDYVDRGKDRIKTLNFIVSLKFFFPDNIFLLRGNHELYTQDESGYFYSPMNNAVAGTHHLNFLTYILNSENPKNKEIVKKNNFSYEFVKLTTQLFDSMPILALFNFDEIKICAVHGGIPRPNLNDEYFFESEDFDSLNRLLHNETKDSVGIKQKYNMLWSDPYDGYEEGFRDTSEVRFNFSKQQFIAFCEKFDVDVMIRAHEQHNDGYKAYFDNRLISVFSSGGRNDSSKEIVNENSYYSSVSPNIIKISSQKISSLNINFTTPSNPFEEMTYYPSDLVTSRNVHKKLKPMKNEQHIQDLIGLKPQGGRIQIFNIRNKNNFKNIAYQDNLVPFNWNNLNEYFPEIPRNLSFQIDAQKLIITNLSKIHLHIGLFGIILENGQSAKLMQNNFILGLQDNPFALSFCIG